MIADLNPAAEAILERPRGQIMGRGVCSLFGEGECPRDTLAEAVAAGRPVLGSTFTLDLIDAPAGAGLFLLLALDPLPAPFDLTSVGAPPSTRPLITLTMAGSFAAIALANATFSEDGSWARAKSSDDAGDVGEQTKGVGCCSSTSPNRRLPRS